MKMFRTLIVTVAMAMLAVTAVDAQVVRRADRDAEAKKTENENNLSVRAKGLYAPNSSAEKDIPWLRVVYRQLDLTKDANLPLYYPEDPTEDLQNLFRIIMRLLADNKVTAYEYLDGREVFTDKYKVNVREMLERFSILYTEQKGSTEKNPLFLIDESDVPCYLSGHTRTAAFRTRIFDDLTASAARFTGNGGLERHTSHALHAADLTRAVTGRAGLHSLGTVGRA